MARGFKTGGRDFQKGAPGRPKGAEDRLPRSAKAAAGLFERFACDTALIEEVLTRGLKSRAPSSFPYLRLVIEQSAGAPAHAVDVRTMVVHKHCRDE